MKKSIRTAGRPDGLTAAVILVLLAVWPSGRLTAQGMLNDFSYDNLKLSGIQVDIGVLGASELTGATVGGVRLDFGRIAPKVRLMLGLSYFSSHFDQKSLDKFATKLDDFVNPGTPDSIVLGQVKLSDIIGDVDFQLAFPQGRGITAYVGAGVSAHIRNGSGAAINGTFVEDALDVVTAGLNGTIGFEFNVARAWRFTLDGRGVLSSGLSTASLRTGVMYRLPAGRSPAAAGAPKK